MHEGLCKCSEFTRLLAIALLNWSDDEGYFMANPILIRGQVFPFLDDSQIIPISLQDLSRVGWISLGKDDQDRAVGFVVNFTKHQRVDKPKPSSIKGNFQFQDASKTHPRRIQGGMEGNGGEEEGNGGDTFALDGTSSDPAQKEISWNINDGFTGITEMDKSRWSDAYPALNIDRQIAAASEWLRSNPKKTKKQYRRFLTGWMTNSQERGGDLKSNPSKPKHAGTTAITYTGDEF
jgi:hypothetical protein